LSHTDVQRLLQESKAELLQRARNVTAKSATVDAQARVRFADGELANLALEDGEFRVRASGALPAFARTPTQALSDLRAALSRRSYASLVRVLSADTSAALEEQLRSLVQALEDPEALEVVTQGDTATVTAPLGHRVALQRENGVWKVRDFE
jgi:hypothetical protein